LARQPFLHHLYELRRRLAWVAGVFVLGSSAGYVWHEPLIELLQHPLGEKLYYNAPGGGFSFVTNVSIFAGMLLAVPVIMYQLIKFIEPAFNPEQRKWSMTKFLMASVILAAIGFVFAYLVVLPSSLKFFAGFSTDSVESLISASDYLRFVTGCLVTFAFVFQIPLVFLLIDRNITPLPPKTLGKYRRHVIVASLAIALALPFTFDPITMGILATPMILLYEVSILLIRIFGRKAPKPVVEAVVEEAEEPVSQAFLPEPLPQPASRPLLPQPALLASDEPELQPVLDLRNARVTPAALPMRRSAPVMANGIIDLRQFSS
jgi:sec-independent protein translocase protein TatC